MHAAKIEYKVEDYTLASPFERLTRSLEEWLRIWDDDYSSFIASEEGNKTITARKSFLRTGLVGLQEINKSEQLNLIIFSLRGREGEGSTGSDPVIHVDEEFKGQSRIIRNYLRWFGVTSLIAIQVKQDTSQLTVLKHRTANNLLNALLIAARTARAFSEWPCFVCREEIGDGKHIGGQVARSTIVNFISEASDQPANPKELVKGQTGVFAKILSYYLSHTHSSTSSDETADMPKTHLDDRMSSTHIWQADKLLTFEQIFEDGSGKKGLPGLDVVALRELITPEGLLQSPCKFIELRASVSGSGSGFSSGSCDGPDSKSLSPDRLPSIRSADSKTYSVRVKRLDARKEERLFYIPSYVRLAAAEVSHTQSWKQSGDQSGDQSGEQGGDECQNQCQSRRQDQSLNQRKQLDFNDSEGTPSRMRQSQPGTPPQSSPSSSTATNVLDFYKRQKCAPPRWFLMAEVAEEGEGEGEMADFETPLVSPGAVLLLSLVRYEQSGLAWSLWAAHVRKGAEQPWSLDDLRRALDFNHFPPTKTTNNVTDDNSKVDPMWASERPYRVRPLSSTAITHSYTSHESALSTGQGPVDKCPLPQVSSIPPAKLSTILDLLVVAVLKRAARGYFVFCVTNPQQPAKGKGTEEAPRATADKVPDESAAGEGREGASRVPNGSDFRENKELLETIWAPGLFERVLKVALMPTPSIVETDIKALSLLPSRHSGFLHAASLFVLLRQSCNLTPHNPQNPSTRAKEGEDVGDKEDQDGEEFGAFMDIWRSVHGAETDDLILRDAKLQELRSLIEKTEPVRPVAQLWKEAQNFVRTQLQAHANLHTPLQHRCDIPTNSHTDTHTDTHTETHTDTPIDTPIVSAEPGTTGPSPPISVCSVECRLQCIIGVIDKLLPPQTFEIECALNALEIASKTEALAEAHSIAAQLLRPPTFLEKVQAACIRDALPQRIADQVIPLLLPQPALHGGGEREEALTLDGNDGETNAFFSLLMGGSTSASADERAGSVSEQNRRMREMFKFESCEAIFEKGDHATSAFPQGRADKVDDEEELEDRNASKYCTLPSRSHRLYYEWTRDQQRVAWVSAKPF